MQSRKGQIEANSFFFDLLSAILALRACSIQQRLCLYNNSRLAILNRSVYDYLLVCMIRIRTKDTGTNDEQYLSTSGMFTIRSVM